MSAEVFLNGRVQLCCGDSMHFLRDQPEGRYDSIVTDPPYALVSIVKRFGKPGSAPAKGNEAYQRASAGFMGKQWDTGEVAFDPAFWAECLRVLKPGGHVVAFSGTRTYHRLASAIEDAGFEIRDQIGWTYGSGFPKSHNIGEGWGTALKPAWEPVVLARKAVEGTIAANMQRHGTGAINVDGCRVDAVEALVRPSVQRRDNEVLGKGLGAGVQVEPPGRWPANIIHDGSEEVTAAFPICDSPRANGNPNERTPGKDGMFRAGEGVADYRDTGSAARFFYTAKADADDRIGSKHPTVKPVDLMQWLVRLVTPKDGLVLDPFAGTGTTAEACFREGMRCMMVEREPEYQDDIRRRMRLILSGPDERKRESIKAKTKDKPVDAGPLFGDALSLE